MPKPSGILAAHMAQLPNLNLSDCGEWDTKMKELTKEYFGENSAEYLDVKERSFNMPKYNDEQLKAEFDTRKNDLHWAFVTYIDRLKQRGQ